MKKSKLNSILFVAVTLILLCIGFWFFIVSSSQSTRFNTQLSNREQEFISERSGNNDQQWNDVNFIQPTDIPSDAGKVSTPCIKLRVPFTISKTSYENGDDNLNCIVRTTVLNPHSLLVITTKPATETLEENPAVKMRRRDPRLYTSVAAPQLVSGQVIGFKTSEELTYFIRTDTKIVTVSFSQVSQIDRLDMSQVDALLKSIELQ